MALEEHRATRVSIATSCSRRHRQSRPSVACADVLPSHAQLSPIVALHGFTAGETPQRQHLVQPTTSQVSAAASAGDATACAPAGDFSGGTSCTHLRRGSCAICCRVTCDIEFALHLQTSCGYRRSTIIASSRRFNDHAALSPAPASSAGEAEPRITSRIAAVVRGRTLSNAALLPPQAERCFDTG